MTFKNFKTVIKILDHSFYRQSEKIFESLDGIGRYSSEEIKFPNLFFYPSQSITVSECEKKFGHSWTSYLK